MQVELQSAALFEKHGSGRPVFRGVVERGFGSRRCYQIFGFGKGFLFLDLGKEKREPGEAGATAGKILGGAIGAYIGSEIEKSIRDGFEEAEKNYQNCSDDELLAMARKSKHSFVACFEEIQSVTIDRISGMREMFGNGQCIGVIKLKEATLGRMKIEIPDEMSMTEAIDAFNRHVGDVTTVKIELDESTMKFVKKRD